MASSCTLKPQRQTCSFTGGEMSAVSATAHKKKKKCICGTFIHAQCKNNRYFQLLRLPIRRVFMEHSAAVAARLVAREAWRAGRVVLEVAVFTPVA